jgi:hypothetical protein
MTQNNHSKIIPEYDEECENGLPWIQRSQFICQNLLLGLSKELDNLAEENLEE